MSDGLIAVVEDEPDVLCLIQLALREQGFETEGYASARALLEGLAQREPDLVVLDLGLPDLDGIALLPRLRTLSAEIPVVILSGRAGDADRIAGLELGADDYLAKPFNPRELVARVRSVLRRAGARRIDPSERSSAQFAGYSYDRGSMILASATAPDVMLGAADARLLEAFLAAPNRVLTREFLLQQIGAEDVLDRAVDVAVSRLRKKLSKEQDGAEAGGSLIRTVYGAGYMFTAKVKWQ